MTVSGATDVPHDSRDLSITTSIYRKVEGTGVGLTFLFHRFTDILPFETLISDILLRFKEFGGILYILGYYYDRGLSATTGTLLQVVVITSQAGEILTCLT